MEQKLFAIKVPEDRDMTNYNPVNYIVLTEEHIFYNFKDEAEATQFEANTNRSDTAYNTNIQCIYIQDIANFSTNREDSECEINLKNGENKKIYFFYEVEKCRQFKQILAQITGFHCYKTKGNRSLNVFCLFFLLLVIFAAIVLKVDWFIIAGLVIALIIMRWSCAKNVYCK